jgi:CPA1 family monovalent cation:H+ antiporter
MEQAVSEQIIGAQGTIETLTALLAGALIVALLARRLRFPYTLALALVGLALGVLHLLPAIELQPSVTLFVFLPALLFEGAWNIDMPALLANWFIILLLAVPGLLVAVLIAALALHFGAGFSPIEAVLLSAIISPTDPIAIIALLRRLGLSSRLRVIIEGESLFNDGIGAVAFTITLSVLLSMTTPPASAAVASQIGLIAFQSAWLLVGGPLLGLIVGYVASRALGHIEDSLIETAATFIVAYGVYLIADLIHTSGLLAVVMAGLMLGSYGRRVGISESARESVEHVWDFTSFLVTSLLFLLLGVQIGDSLSAQALAPTLWATLGVLVGRAVIVYGTLLPYDAVARWYRQRHQGEPARGRPAPIPRSWRPLIVLSGLRGALSIALALSLPANLPDRALIASVVYGVVLITLVGQGVGLRALLPRWPGLRDGHDGHTPAPGATNQPSAQPT